MSATRRGRQRRTRNACNSSPARVADGDHGRRDHEHRRARVVLELRHVRRHLRAGHQHHVVLEHERHRDEHDQRHVDGDAARGRRGRALPAGEPGRLAVRGDAGADHERDAQPRDERRHRLAEPAAVLALRRPTASTATASTTAAASARASTATASASDRADRERRLRRLGLAWTQSGNAYWSTARTRTRAPATRSSAPTTTRAGASTRRCASPRARRRTSRSGSTSRRARRAARRTTTSTPRWQHVGHAALDARHVDERELGAAGRTRRSRSASRAGAARRSRPVPRDDRHQPADELPHRRRLTEVGHSRKEGRPKPPLLPAHAATSSSPSASASSSRPSRSSRRTCSRETPSSLAIASRA